MKEKIYFDTNWVGPTGIGRFSSEIIKGIPAITKIPIKGNPLSFSYMIKLSIFLFFSSGKYFTPGFNVPLICLKKTIITLHDLNHIDLDYNSSIFKRMYYSIFLKNACKKCYSILTVSEFSKKRIVDWSGVDESKVIVVGNGVSDSFSSPDEKSINGLDNKKYILMVSNRKIHKNEQRAIQAFSAAMIDEQVLLYITGCETPELVELIKRLNIKDKVIFLGKLTDERLITVYKNAIMLLFPSLYEGFGLPVIEAMKSGLPVVTSKTTSLGEIAGDAAFLIDPTSVEDISRGIENVFNDESLRTELIEKGYGRAQEFSWDSVIQKTNVILGNFN
ncbi:glycosyltransferase family 4 protein [Klebsiella pneumoniae]|uniref:glycosyltransferase family 4 protein n=1 Tax=Klebsiella pneumoniae TaxID=573 RepID=UPI001FAD3F9F|nr:glycosyltransferase family 1 protein [Klebsiella pneumoniae]MCI8181594.1 glycosyltransferase family 4 protein [Klebsiella pneumoniae]MCP5704956.1 glycosyltransferase family 4 protein [Klebsiella pneumoniae]MCP6065268.1 glycosyltransferase family 4 protein [Klebsiella pneumoniae]MCP6209467.1 glycosyltransferase family 4 protein [Klebsiella pneumoniae]WLE35691.1 glycosyltransferase family 4 protein [Klebsiella pneumoniae]